MTVTLRRVSLRYVTSASLYCELAFAKLNMLGFLFWVTYYK
jgi:hypothetical protein